MGLIVCMILRIMLVLMHIHLRLDGLWMDLVSMEDILVLVLLGLIALRWMIVEVMIMTRMDIIIMLKSLMDKLKEMVELLELLWDKLILLLLTDPFNVIKLIFHYRLIIGKKIKKMMAMNYINLVVICLNII